MLEESYIVQVSQQKDGKQHDALLLNSRKKYSDETYNGASRNC